MIRLEGCVCLILLMLCKKRRSAWSYLHSATPSLIILVLQLSHDGPGNEQSWVVRLLRIPSPLAFKLPCTATPNGVTQAPGIKGMVDGRIGIAHCAAVSFRNDLSSAL